jgi:hypothetical protein
VVDQKIAIFKEHWDLFGKLMINEVRFIDHGLESSNYSIMSHDLRDVEGLFDKLENQYHLDRT